MQQPPTTTYNIAHPHKHIVKGGHKSRHGVRIKMVIGTAEQYYLYQTKLSFICYFFKYINNIYKRGIPKPFLLEKKLIKLYSKFSKVKIRKRHLKRKERFDFIVFVI
jgi:hypothetical protein